jgi:hypothetical protein
MKREVNMNTRILGDWLDSNISFCNVEYSKYLFLFLLTRVAACIRIKLYLLNIAAYCVVAVESVGRQVPIAYLERIKEDFTKRYGGGKAATAVSNSLNKEFG